MNSRFRTFAQLTVLSLLTLATPLSARAESSETTPPAAIVEKAQQLHAEGIAAYRARNYRRAVTKFEQAYAEAPEVTILYNLARCLEALGEIDTAIEKYEGVVKDAKSDADLREKSQSRLDILKAAAAENKTAPAETEHAPSAKTREQNTAKPDPATSVSTTAPASSGEWMSYAKWGAGGVGLAAIIVGAIEVTGGASDHSKIDDAKTAAGGGIAGLTQSEAQRLYDDGKQKKTLGVILLSGGAAALAVSGILFFAESSTPEPELSAVVAFDADGGAFAITGKF